MKRIQTGIDGFDELLQGGLPQGSCTLLSGTPGTCKTIFALQYIQNGATKFNQKGLFVSIEQTPEQLKRQGSQFGWDLERLERDDLIKIIHIPPDRIKDSTAKEILDLVVRDGYSRVVVDSLNALAINSPTTYLATNEISEFHIKRFIYKFITNLRGSTATILAIGQTYGEELSQDGVAEFICDGIIHMRHEPMGGRHTRALMIRKMRETKNDEDVHPVELAEQGLIVHSLD